MMKIRRAVNLFVLVAILLVNGRLTYSSQLKDLPQLKIAKRVGQCALMESADGKIRVLLLQGSPYQIGYAHGKLLSKEVKSVLQRVLTVAKAADSRRKKDFFANTLASIYKQVAPYIPARYHQELAGLADGAGMSRTDVELANIFPEMFHCSGFTFMKSATKDGKLIHVRILDYMTAIGLQDYGVVIVSRPTGCNTSMIASYTGFIGCITGLNDKQIGIGEMGMGGFGHWQGMPMPYMLRAILEECNSLNEAVNFMKRTRRECEYAYVISDGKIPSSVGVHAKYDSLETIKPGEYHPMLPKPIKDCVLITAGGRYETLVARTKKYFGKIDPAIACEIIKRPVAMKSNLHDAIMLPQEQIMYLAQAGNPTKTEKFQACYQPYYKYDLRVFAKKLDELASKYKPEGQTYISLTNSINSSNTKAQTKQPTIIKGIVPAKFHRKMKEEENEKIAKLLKRFQTPARDFPYEMKLVKDTEYYTVWLVTFPSPYKSPVERNNSVWCEYFKSKVKKQNKPAVILLHYLQNDFTVPRVICHLLASQGIDAMLVKMAYYGQRRPKNFDKKQQLMGNPNNLVNAVVQSVMDIRRAAEFLAAQSDVDKNRIGICGISLGALVGALTIGVDGNFDKAVLVIGGGDLLGIIKAKSREVSQLNQYIKQHNLTDDDLKEIFKPIEPLTYIDRAKRTKVLMLNASGDNVIPRKCTMELASRLDNPKLIWYNVDHRGMIWHLIDAVTKIQQFFSDN